jgi:uncharacterized membrane protein YcaP (DUF421 family)
VGDAMFYPEVPLVHCMVVITVVVLLDKGLSYVVTRSRRLEDLIEGKSVELARDGVINCKALDRLNFGHDELFEQLRLKDVEHLGQVRAAYLETNGSVSVFKRAAEAESPGLSIDPPWDVQAPHEMKAGAKADRGDGLMACARCATVAIIPSGETLSPCPHCHGEVWHALQHENPATA